MVALLLFARNTGELMPVMAFSEETDNAPSKSFVGVMVKPAVEVVVGPNAPLAVVAAEDCPPNAKTTLPVVRPLMVQDSWYFVALEIDALCDSALVPPPLACVKTSSGLSVQPPGTVQPADVSSSLPRVGPSVAAVP